MFASRLIALVLAVSACSIATAAEFEPIKEGDTLTGKLRLVPTRHPNGTKIEAYQIVSRPRAMPKGDDFCDYDKGATTFHLFTTFDGAREQLKPHVGELMTVKAITLFCSQTAWHIGDVAVPEWAFLLRFNQGRM